MHRFNSKHFIILVILLIIVCVQIAFASELKDAKKERLEIVGQIEEIVKEKEIKQDIIKEKEDEKNKLNEKIDHFQESLAIVTDEYETAFDDFENLRNIVKEAEEDYSQKSETAKESILRLYKKSKSTYTSILVNSENIFEMFKKLNYVSAVIDSDRRLINDALSFLREKEAKEALLREIVEQKYDNVRNANDRVSDLQTSRSGVERQIREENTEISQLDQKTNELEEYSKELVEEIKELQKDSNEYVGGGMLWPVPSGGYVISKFGMRIHPIKKIWKMHNGIDIAASYNRYIVAANDGIVVSSGYISGYGYSVVIDHGGGISTLYAHANKLIARSGDLVFKGDLIALVGSTGLSTGPHLHFEVRIDGVPKNPFNYLE